MICAMRMAHMRTSFLALALFLACSVFGPAFAQAPAHIVDISDPQNGGTVAAFAGDTVRLRLHSTPGTGYSWQLDKVDTKVLAQQGAPIFVPPPQNIPGAEGHMVFKFLAASPGSSPLQLSYVRPWEKGAAPARTFQVTVTVRPATDRPMPQP